MPRKPTGRPRRTVHERIVDAETRSARALGNANEARERGRPHAEARWLYSAQKWLDTANRLRGYGDGSE
jgi:hypothetical protein